MILLQSHTKQQIDRLIASPTHGVLISGPEGSGKSHVASYIAAKLLGTSLEKLSGQPYFKLISPEDGSLKIDQIRDLQKFLQLKTPGTAGIRRIIIIENAQLMTGEAQNALLKALEEPPADTVIILTSPASQKLKQTIYSRVQQIAVLPVDQQQAMDYFQADFAKAELSKAYMMSNGHIGLMHALLHDSDHALAGQIVLAKEVIGADNYSRLLRVDEIAKQKELLPTFLQACKLICSTALEQSASNGSGQTKRWHKALEATYQAEAALPHNPNLKLLITDLMLSL